jgi:hypothetical protein
MRIWNTFILRLLPLIGTCLDVSLLARSSSNYLLERFDSRACWLAKSDTHAMPSPGNVITYWNLSRREQITYWNFLLAGVQKARRMPCPHQETWLLIDLHQGNVITYWLMSRKCDYLLERSWGIVISLCSDRHLVMQPVPSILLQSK